MNIPYESVLTPAISSLGYLIEVIGVITIAAGFITATVTHLRNTAAPRMERYRTYRHDLAQHMMMGLEFLVAGDIIRTVIVANSLDDVASLGLVVLIRTILVFTIHLEVEGRWPWQRSE